MNFWFCTTCKDAKSEFSGQSLLGNSTPGLSLATRSPRGMSLDTIAIPQEHHLALLEVEYE